MFQETWHDQWQLQFKGVDMIEIRYYWPILDSQTKEVSSTPIKAEYRGGIYHIPKDALKVEPKLFKKGFAVIATDDLNDTAYIEDYRDKIIWNQSDCAQSKQVSELGILEEGWTFLEPVTPFDEWIIDAWATNTNNQYIANYDKVDSIRRSLYSQMCDPLYTESGREKRRGNLGIAQALEMQADAAAEIIKNDNPWPIPPKT